MSSKKDPVQFVKVPDQTPVDESLFAKGDWVLRWAPSEANSRQSGFELYTPPEFGPDAVRIPLGGTALAAIFYLLERSNHDFAAEMIARANLLAGQESEQEVNPSIVKPTLN